MPLSNANPHPQPMFGGLQYEQPDVFDQSASKGSSPVICCPNDEIDLSPAQVTSIRLVRLIEAQRQYETTAAMRKVDVNLDPEAEGHYAAVMCHQRKSCPYPAKTPERKLWMENFDAYSGVET